MSLLTNLSGGRKTSGCGTGDPAPLSPPAPRQRNDSPRLQQVIYSRLCREAEGCLSSSVASLEVTQTCMSHHDVCMPVFHLKPCVASTQTPHAVTNRRGNGHGNRLEDLTLLDLQPSLIVWHWWILKFFLSIIFGQLWSENDFKCPLNTPGKSHTMTKTMRGHAETGSPISVQRVCVFSLNSKLLLNLARCGAHRREGNA